MKADAKFYIDVSDGLTRHVRADRVHAAALAIARERMTHGLIAQSGQTANDAIDFVDAVDEALNAELDTLATAFDEGRAEGRLAGIGEAADLVASGWSVSDLRELAAGDSGDLGDTEDT